MFQIALTEAPVPFVERSLRNLARMIGLHDFEGELLFGFERMRVARQRTTKQQWIIARHQLIGNAHQFPEHGGSGLVDRNKIAETLAHFFRAIQALQNWKEKNDLLRQTFLFLEVAPYQNIKKLVRSAELDIGFHHHRVPALHDRILNFVGTDGLLVLNPVPEILTLQHLLQRNPTVQANDVFERHRSKPVAIANNLRGRRIKNLERLLTIG